MNLSSGSILCIASLLLCSYAARYSLGAGVSALMAVGYFFGILRANYLDGFSHFIFDIGILGFYAVQFLKPVSPEEEIRSRRAKNWLILLMGWPVILFLLPINHYLVQLVGLRHIVLALPAMLLGARFRIKDLNTITTTLAALNIVAFGFAIAQYIYGIEPFFPHNSVTDLMYRSGDIKAAGERFHRIPSTFSNAHAYGGTAVMTLPLIVNAMVDSTHQIPRRVVMGIACIITILGIFIAGPRVPVVMLGGCFIFMMLLPGLKTSTKSGLVLGALAIGLVCSIFIIDDPRMQRFTSLADVGMVERRATGSFDFSIWECFWQYPIGVGLGGAAGSSLPFFLKAYAPEVYVGAENEYIRIAAEQGVVGFAIWMIFLLNFLMRRPRPISKQWQLGTHMAWALILFCWAGAFMGLGMLQSIPNSFLMVFLMGLLLRDRPAPAPEIQRQTVAASAAASGNIPPGLPSGAPLFKK